MAAGSRWRGDLPNFHSVMCPMKLVMPGLVPGIHVFGATYEKSVDGRDKPGYDESYMVDAARPCGQLRERP